MSVSTLLDLRNWYAMPTTLKRCARSIGDMPRAHAVAIASYMSDRYTEHMYTYRQAVNSAPGNSVEHFMHPISYGAILYVLNG
eukprot:11624145-Alexandrium_andersonii.AAC.1